MSKNSVPTKIDDLDSEQRRRYERSLMRYRVAVERIENLVDSLGLSRAEFARRLGKSRPWVSKVLGGRQNLTLDSLADIGWALGVSWTVEPVQTVRSNTPAASDLELPNWVRSPPYVGVPVRYGASLESLAFWGGGGLSGSAESGGLLSGGLPFEALGSAAGVSTAGTGFESVQGVRITLAYVGVMPQVELSDVAMRVGCAWVSWLSVQGGRGYSILEPLSVGEPLPRPSGMQVIGGIYGESLGTPVALNPGREQ